mmetsp:Transcript_88451/g.249263  ORF Transcript_88451/g.249263 Transcript_88451/m.249263 type:complete len:363 (+) Transcript_88451:1252-2340(+)
MRGQNALSRSELTDPRQGGRWKARRIHHGPQALPSPKALRGRVHRGLLVDALGTPPPVHHGLRPVAHGTQLRLKTPQIPRVNALRGRAGRALLARGSPRADAVRQVHQSLGRRRRQRRPPATHRSSISATSAGRGTSRPSRWRSTRRLAVGASSSAKRSGRQASGDACWRNPKCPAALNASKCITSRWMPPSGPPRLAPSRRGWLTRRPFPIVPSRSRTIAVRTRSSGWRTRIGPPRRLPCVGAPVGSPPSAWSGAQDARAPFGPTCCRATSSSAPPRASSGVQRRESPARPRGASRVAGLERTARRAGRLQRGPRAQGREPLPQNLHRRWSTKRTAAQGYLRVARSCRLRRRTQKRSRASS